MLSPSLDWQQNKVLNKGRIIADVIYNIPSLTFNKTGHAVNEINICSWIHKMQSLSIRGYSNNPQGVQSKWDLALVFNLGADCHALIHNEIVNNFAKIMCFY